MDHFRIVHTFNFFMLQSHDFFLSRLFRSVKVLHTAYFTWLGSSPISRGAADSVALQPLLRPSWECVWWSATVIKAQRKRRDSPQSAASRWTNAGKYYSPARALSSSDPTQPAAGAYPSSGWCRGPADSGGTWSATGGRGTAGQTRTTHGHNADAREARSRRRRRHRQLSPELHPSLIRDKRPPIRGDSQFSLAQFNLPGKSALSI